jgi:hypothetical protein
LKKTRFSKRGFPAFVLALCTTGLIGLVAAPAQAAPPFDHSNFHPVELQSPASATNMWSYGNTGGGGNRADWLSDKEDGKGTGAHLTVVATEDTTQVDWYFCTAGSVTDPPTGPADISGCTPIASDATPRSPSDPTAFAAADEAYDITWDIPNAVDSQQRDILSLACIGAPAAGAEPGTNCRGEVENNIWLDSVETGANPQTSSGEWHEYDPTASAGAAAGNQKFALEHGINVPNGGFTATGRTSPEITAVFGDLLGPTVDAQNPPALASPDISGPGGVLGTSTALFKEWTIVFSAGNVPDNGEFLLGLTDGDAGGFTTTLNDATDPPADPVEDCPVSGDFTWCVFDAHYAVSVANAPNQVHIHNDETADDVGVVDVFDDAATSLCGDQNRTKTGAVATNESDQVIGCVYDQFTSFSDLDTSGDQEMDDDHLLTPEATFEISGGGGTFAPSVPPAPTTGSNAGCEGGTVHDHNSDGLFEHCHFDGTDYGADNKAGAQFLATTGGSITVKFCVDPDQDTSAAAGHGCGDAGSLTDSAAKNATPEIQHNHLRLTSEATGDCHAGTGSTTAQAGTVVNLTGCPQDAFHNSAPNTRVIWRIGAGDAFDPAQFVGTPEQTTDASGKADAAITSPTSAGGSFSNIFFCGDVNENGVCDGVNTQAQFQISWTAPPGGGGDDGQCAKIKRKIRRLKKKIRAAKADGNERRVDNLRDRLRDLRERRRAVC